MGKTKINKGSNKMKTIKITKENGPNESDVTISKKGNVRILQVGMGGVIQRVTLTNEEINKIVRIANNK